MEMASIQTKGTETGMRFVRRSHLRTTRIVAASTQSTKTVVASAPAGHSRDAHPQGGLLGPLHGYGILLRIQQISGERLEILQGSFYTAIYRLERRGWIKGEWGESENNRRARFYSPTAAGMRQLKAETAKWIDMAAVVADILDKKADEI